MKSICINIAAIIVVMLFTCMINAQVKTKTFAAGIPENMIFSKKGCVEKEFQVRPLADFINFTQQAENNDAKGGLDKFALPTSVNIILLNEATIIENDGIARYSLIIKENSALSVSIQVSRFLLSKKMWATCNTVSHRD